jgi:hypothetical protein
MEKIKQVSIGAWIALSVIALACAAIVIWAPPHFWEILGAADWRHIAGVITLVGSAIVGIFVKWQKEHTPAPPQGDRPTPQDNDPSA